MCPICGMKIETILSTNGNHYYKEYKIFNIMLISLFILITFAIVLSTLALQKGIIDFIISLLILIPCNIITLYSFNRIVYNHYRNKNYNDFKQQNML